MSSVIRQQAFEGGGPFLKGGLHCHTTRSDAYVSPEEVLRIYYECGYDFAAITDHRNYNYINYAPDLPLTILPGMEFDNMFEQGKGFRCFHTVCIGPSKEAGSGYEQDVVLDSGTAKSQEEYQAYLDEIHANKNLTVYCHPEWSSTPARCFEKLQGDFALEIWNSTCALGHNSDRDAACWDELLGQGKRIYGVAANDGHEIPYYGKGGVMVRSENTVNAILKALSEGKFYSSCGPEIYDFYVENGRATVKCSPACKVCFCSDMHPNYIVGGQPGRIVTEATEN